MSATRYGGRRVNDVLVRSNILQGRQTANAEASAACLRQHRATGYAVLENKHWKLSSFGNFHQQTLRLRIFDAVYQPTALMHVSHGLGQGDAGLNEHHDAHREIALDPEINRQKVDADRDQEGRGAERTVGKGDPGVAVMLDILIHGGVLLM